MPYWVVVRIILFNTYSTNNSSEANICISHILVKIIVNKQSQKGNVSNNILYLKILQIREKKFFTIGIISQNTLFWVFEIHFKINTEQNVCLVNNNPHHVKHI